MSRFLKVTLLLCLSFFLSCNYVPDTHKANDGGTEVPATKAQKPKRDAPYTGILLKKHPNGKVKSEINFIDGVQQGPAKEYHDNGKLYKDINYRDGYLDGKAKIYDRKGRVSRMVTYAHGTKNGPMIRYFKSGKPKSEMTYKDGVPQNDLWEKDNRGNITRNFGELQIRTFQSTKSDDLFALEFRLDNGKLFESYVYPAHISQKQGISRTYSLQGGRKADVHQKRIRIPKGTDFEEELVIAALYKTSIGNEVLISKKEVISLVHLY
jgi:hypothetical protein